MAVIVVFVALYTQSCLKSVQLLERVHKSSWKVPWNVSVTNLDISKTVLKWVFSVFGYGSFFAYWFVSHVYFVCFKTILNVNFDEYYKAKQDKTLHKANIKWSETKSYCLSISFNFFSYFVSTHRERKKYEF